MGRHGQQEIMRNGMQRGEVDVTQDGRAGEEAGQLGRRRLIARRA